MLKRIRCDGSCARGSRLLNRDCCGHGLRCCATSRSPVGRDSCRPGQRAALLARSAVERDSCSTATRNGVDRAWLGLGRAFQFILNLS